MSQSLRDAEEALEGIGDRIRTERTRAGISQRELARRVGLSPSLISQLENGVSKPSVGTLYAIVAELDVSLDELIRGDGGSGDGMAPSPVTPPALPGPVVRPGERKVIDLDSGVRWEQLSGATEEGVDFLEAIYDVGGSSTPDESLMRHHGREYGYVVSGVLGVQIGFEHHVLNPGDSIAFDSTRPHRLFNMGDVPAHAIWIVVGRDEADRGE